MSFDFLPIPPTTIITTLFGQVDSSHQNPHGGVDFAVPVGTQVWAPSDGTVSRIFSDSGGGNVLEITHDGGIKTLYMHLSGYNVGINQSVSGGDTVAFSGGAAGAAGAGHSTGPHLHFEVRDTNNNKFNPLDFLPNTWTLSANLAKLIGKDVIEGGTATSFLMIALGGIGAFFLWKILQR